MTISVEDYFGSKLAVRKKEPQYVAYINKNSCTSCNSCASMCPVDCIFEVTGTPAQSYHQIDISRCIGCQMCYRVPSESTGPWTMEICPWNAIDLIHNPNVKQWESLLEPYYQGSEKLDLRKLEEIGYQFYLNRMMYVKKGGENEKQLAPLTKPEWSWGEEPFAIVELSEDHGEFATYVNTSAGEELVDLLYREYEHMYLD